MANSNWGDVYKELGAQPIINAIGSLSLLGGSTPPSEVKDAMNRADSAYISLIELQEKAGQAIADLVNVPAAFITSGAGSALTLATAAIMAGDDTNKIQQLPDTTGMRNEILIQKRQRYWYDRCLELAGARLVEFGSNKLTTRSDLENAIGPNTAAVHHFAWERSPHSNVLPVEDTIDIAHSNGVPVMVDAARDIYPLESFGKYVRMGADFQTIAAKYIGAPQSTGLALGTPEMIHKIFCNSFIGYEGRKIRGIGRPQKIDRQEMIGLVAAVRRWFTMDHEERLANVEQQCQNVIAPLKNVSGVTVKMIESTVGNHPFGVQLNVDPTKTTLTVQDVVDKLKMGDPPIWTRVEENEDYIVIHPFGFAEGEDKIVGERIALLFK